MNQERIFYGSAGFLVEKIDENSEEELATFLKEEGFESTKWINLPKSGLIHVNIESMRYGYTIIGINIASYCYDEIPDHPFTIREFKTIWNVLKKHRSNKKRSKGSDRSLLNVGYSSFLVKDDNLEDASNDFWTYLVDEKFSSLKNNDNPHDWVLINVGNSTYINSTDNIDVMNYVKNNIEYAITCDEFKTIWEVIRKHR